MRKKYKASQMLVAATAAMVLLSGCNAGGAGKGGDTPSSSPAAAAADYLKNPATYKFDPAVTITSIGFQPSKDTYKPGESETDNFWLKWVHENIGIDIKNEFVVPQYSDYETRVRLLLAGGDKLPDVLGNTQVLLANDLIDSGKVAPLNDLIEQYASPNMKALYEKYSNAMAGVTRDGKIYGLPNFFAMDEGTVMWVRQDWLDKLKLQAPKTMDEFENVIRAFTEDDPDGNGKKDTMGLALSMKNGPVTWMSTTDGIAGALSGGKMPNTFNLQEFWTPSASGELQWDAIDPGNKAFLAKMREWMEKGYVDPEIGVKDEAKAAEMASGGKAGILFGPNWMAGWPLGDGDAANFTAYPLPAGADGKAVRGEKAMVHSFVMLNKDFKHPEAFFAYWNKVMAANFGPDDPYYDARLKDGWAEGYDYVKYDGKIIRGNYEEKGVPSDKWPNPADASKSYNPEWILFDKPYIPYLGDSFTTKLKDDPEAEPSNWMEARLATSTARQLAAGIVRISQNDSAVENLFTGAPTKTMKAKTEMLTKLATESYLKIIYGQEPVDYFDSFVEQWKKSGGDEITKEVNAWYDSVKK